MTGNIDEEVLERLEAEAITADADAEELTLAVESDIEQTEERVEELQEEVEEKETEVEELQGELEEKENMVEELQEEVDAVAETYAEELAKDSSALDKNDFLDKFEFEELREKYDDLEISASPDPNSGDPGAGFQPENPDPENEGNEPEELSPKAEAAVEEFEQRGGVWEELAEDIKENGLGEPRIADQPDDDEIFG